MLREGERQLLLARYIDQMRSDLDMGLHMRLLSMLGHSATAVTAAAAGDIETLKNFLSKKPEAVSFCS